MDTTDFSTRLTQLAQARDAVAKRKVVAQEMRAKFYALYVKPYDDEVAAADSALANQEAQLRADMLAEVLSTGDIGALPAGVTFVRGHEWMYDEEKLLEACQEKNATKYLRVKTTLNKIELNKTLEANAAPDWMDVERVNAPSIRISSKLGDLTIKAEFEADDASKVGAA